MDIEKTLKKLFEYQRFEQNEHLSSMLRIVMDKYDLTPEGELDDDDVDQLNAAGSYTVKPDDDDPLKRL